MADTNLNIKVRLQNLVTGEMNKVKNSFKGLKSVKQDWVAVTAKIYLFVNAIRTASRALSGFINASDKVEQLQVRLKVLFGSAEAGNRVFEDMAELAGKVPKTYDEIMESATALGGVVKGGTEEVAELMPMMVDLSSATGIALRDVTSQMIRMYSAGAASADMFRERGVLAMLGFQAGVSYTAEETMRRVMNAWNEAGSKFKGASDELAKTWSGKMSMMQDAWFNFSKEVGEFLTSNEGVNWWLDEFKFAMEYWAEYIQKNLNTQATALDLLEDKLAKINKRIEGTQKLLSSAFTTWEKTFQTDRLNELWKERMSIVQAINMEHEILAQKTVELDTITVEGNKEKKKTFKDYIKEMQEDFNMTKTLAEQSARNMQNAFSDFFFDTMKGEFDSLTDILTSFGDAMLRMFANLMAQKAVLNMFDGFMGIGGTPTPAPASAIGSNYIPRTGAYMLHQGERVVPAGNVRDEGGGGGVTINVNQAITAWDASDVYRNRKALADAVAYEIQSNGSIRSAIQNYT